MTRRLSHKAILALMAAFVLAIGGFGQGRGHGGGGDHHGGGGGNPHGNGNGGGRGQEVRQMPQPQHQSQQRGGGGNPHWNGGGQQRRVFEQQSRQVGIQQQQRQQVWQQQQRQQVWQQRQSEWNGRMQQRAIQQQQRQQQEAMRRQYQQPQQPRYMGPPQAEARHDNGRHNGWTDNAPRGNAYGLRGMAPGQNRDQHNWTNLNTQAWQGRRGDRDRDRNMRANSATYYTYDPLTSYLPRQSRVQVYNYYNGSGYNGYNSGYGNYNPYSSYGYYAPPQNTIVRTIIASYFAPDDAYYADYYTPQYFSYQAPAYYYDYPGDYSYSPAGYSYSYAPAGYYQDGYYDPYQFGGVPMFASPFYGDNSVKASLLSFGVQMLQGLLGQGYVQGLNYGHYYRTYNPGVYYDPYQPSDVAYYSPYVSSFADQRQTFEQGYRLGYEDAMRNQDPYGNLYGNERVDLVSQFLANSLIGS